MRAFTLVETLIYLVLFSLLMTGAVASLISVRSNAGRIEAGARLTDEGHFILERLRYAIEHSYAVTVESESRISIESTDETRSFYIENDSLIEAMEHAAFPLTEPTTVVPNFQFRMDPDESVSISFTLRIPTSEGLWLIETFSEVIYPLNRL